jgi:hypothetical protein
MKAIEKVEEYQIYANHSITEIPKDILYKIINLVLIEASRNMGNEFNDKMLDAIIMTIEENSYNLPLCYIVSAIYRGSMGFYGPGRLMPRTVLQWLRESSQEYYKERDHKEIEKRFKVTNIPVDLKKYPMGKAICKKIDWLTSGAITSDEYDKISLKQVAEIIGAGHEPNLEYFGIIKNNNYETKR